MWDNCSLGTLKSSAVSAFDSDDVNEVMLDSDSPGPTPQPERGRPRDAAMATTGRKFMRFLVKFFMSHSSYPRPGASVQARAYSSRAPGGRQAGWPGRFVRSPDSRADWRPLCGRRIH